MKKLGIFLSVFVLSAVMQAQEKTSFSSRLSEKGILNHMDIGVNVGTLGIGLDVAVPVGNYLRVRAGYNYLPSFTIKSDFNLETRNGRVDLKSKFDKINDKLAEYNIDLNSPGNEEYKALYDKFRDVELKDYVTMGLTTKNIHQFKFLVDVMPFKHNKHWSFTAGFFVGTSDVVSDVCNLEEETLILEGVNAYNNMYEKYCLNDGLTVGDFTVQLRDLDNNGVPDPRTDRFYKYGLAGFKLGTFDDGTTAMMVPDKDNKVHVDVTGLMKNKFRPYLGFGYNTHLSKNKKWNLNVDAGIMFLCGAPNVYVDNVYKIDISELRFDENGNYLGGIGFAPEYGFYGDIVDYHYYGDIVRFNPETYDRDYVGVMVNHVDLVNDLHNLPGKVGSTVNTLSKLKVYPNLSATFSYRLY